MGLDDGQLNAMPAAKDGAPAERPGRIASD
jgi:hypothetical protein